MRRYVDRLASPRWSEISPQLARRIPANRAIHAAYRALAALERSTDQMAELSDRMAELERKRRLRR